MNFNKICVIGLGYIGLPTASMFATHGIQVVGVDINQDILATLNNGGLHIHEPGLHALVSQAFILVIYVFKKLQNPQMPF